MKILLVSSSSGSRGGGELYLLFLTAELVQRGHQVSLLCSEDGRMDELAYSFKSFGNVFRVRFRNTYDYRLRSLAHLFPNRVKNRIREVALDWGADVVHLNKQNVEDGLDLMEGVCRVGVPHLCTIHITQPLKQLGGKWAFFRDTYSRHRLTRYQAPLVAVGSQRAVELTELLPECASRIRMIPNGVELPTADSQENLREVSRDTLSVSSKELLFLAVGRLEEQKNPFRFLEEAAGSQGVSGLRWIWVGDGRLRDDWESKKRDLGIEGRVDCVGWQREVNSYYSAADVFVHPAEYEGLPFALLEAMAWGLPCFALPSLIAELEPVMREGVFPLEGDWVKLACDADWRSRAAKAARRVIENHFSRAKMAEAYERLYAEVIGKT